VRHPLRSSLLLLAAIGATVEVRADEPVSTIPPELVLERFAVNKGGDCLLVPVKIAGKERLFVVDTGCTQTVVDKTIPLGEPRESITANSPQGDVLVQVYACPDGSVGQLPLRVESVLGLDFNRLREVSGHPIEGFLGMDFLASYAVHVDFDRGELLFLKSGAKSVGDVLPIHWTPDRRPAVDIWLSQDQISRFLVDSGFVSPNGGLIESDTLTPLIRGGDYQKDGSGLLETGAGTHTASMFRGKQIWFGNFSVVRPIFGESPATNLLGLGFWSRFVVTFDFPSQKLYLRKGIAYERSDLRGLSGLDLVRRNGAVVVHGVVKGRPAEAAGIQTGDVLLTLGTSEAAETSLFEIRKALSQGGPLACSVRRGSEERRVTLDLPR
jgi:hypothetical protein